MLLKVAELVTWSKVATHMLILDAYGFGFIPTPGYDDRIYNKWQKWRRVTKKYKMPRAVREVVLRGIKFGSKLGFELEPPNEKLPRHKWTDPIAWNAAAEASIKAIKNGIWNVNPSDVRRINQYFVIDTALP